MRNRAKCKLCEHVIESFHRYDYVTCKCGEISVYEGPEGMKCATKDWNNFIRVDDEGNEIIPKVVDQTSGDKNTSDNPSSRLKRSELVDMLDTMIKSDQEHLPEAAFSQPVSQYDLYRYLLIICSIFKSNDEK